MRKLVAILASSFVLVSLPSLAKNEIQSVEPMDHHGPDNQLAADYAYRIADIGERYQRSFGDLADAGRELHLVASDLYHALQGGTDDGRFGMAPMDHRGGDVGGLLSRLGDAVRYFSRVAPFYDSIRVERLYRKLTDALNM